MKPTFIFKNNVSQAGFLKISSVIFKRITKWHKKIHVKESGKYAKQTQMKGNQRLKCLN